MTIEPENVKIGSMSNILQHNFPPDLSSIYNEKLANQLANTQGAIGGLNQMIQLLHNPLLLMRPILGKEAESSAQLEGTQASIEDAYQIDITEQTPEKRNEALEIRNYQDAMLAGWKTMKAIPLTNTVIRNIHKVLMKGVRGFDKHPGEYRKGDVWIGTRGTKKGEARYVAPDAIHVPQLMESLENFIRSSRKINPLVVCGVIHHRFEAIHPFEDGNGRTGRLLISLYLIHRKMLPMPILYPSGYFEKNRKEYTDYLSGVDKRERWYAWLFYFLKGMETQARLSLRVGLEIDKLFKSSRATIENERAGLSLIRVLEYTFTKPYLTAVILRDDLKLPKTTGTRYLATLAQKHIIDEIGTHKRQKVYVNRKLLDILKKI